MCQGVFRFPRLSGGRPVSITEAGVKSDPPPGPRLRGRIGRDKEEERDVAGT
jgi:hypothetical protein